MILIHNLIIYILYNINLFIYNNYIFFIEEIRSFYRILKVVLFLLLQNVLQFYISKKILYMYSPVLHIIVAENVLFYNGII